LISKCFLSPSAFQQVCLILDPARVYLQNRGDVVAEVEFRELPYFFVLRSRDKWQEGKPDPHHVQVKGANALGLFFEANSAADQGDKTVFVPWANVISFSIPNDSTPSGD
jgi:hypothetical protein